MSLNLFLEVKMKVCFIVGTLGRGGAERQLMFMLQALKNCGIWSRILCLTKDESYEDQIRSKGIKIDWIGSHENRGRRLLSIISNLKNDPPDILQSSHFYTNIYAGLAGKFLRLPSIGAVRSDLISEINLHGILGKYQVSLPKFLIVNSKLAYERAIDHGISPDKVEFVRNVVETEMNGAKSSNASNIKMLFVGRLDENKRPEHFVKLAAKITESYADVPVKFQIAGDGELRKKLENMALSFDLSADKLEFLGICSDMQKVYEQADVLVSTSVREGTSNVILEAMANGLPVIATRSGGTPDILNDQRGFLVEPDNEKELINAATKLILDKGLRNELGENGREFVKNNHSLERLQEQLSGIYERLIIS